jgi:L-threonylcarbamoyladenylate synthase
MLISSPAASTEEIEQAAALLQAGRLVAFPTETVYGLGADATNPEAVVTIFEAKGRPKFNPLIIHVQNFDAAEPIIQNNRLAQKLAEAFWPGPLTLVLPRTQECRVCHLAGAGLDTLAVRVPAHPIAQKLLAATKFPIAAPSANKSGKVSPTTAEHVLEDFGDQIPKILDGGPCKVGVESTVVDVTAPQKPMILRQGGVPAEDIEAICGPLETLSLNETNPGSPGMMLKHYATNAPLKLNAEKASTNEALLAFGPYSEPTNKMVLNLSQQANLKEAAANLFDMMRNLDKMKPAAIAVMPIPESGLGAAINDRLRRAAKR